MTTTPSPRPWHVDTADGMEVYTATGESVCVATKEDAALIVAAVNAYEGTKAMRDALEAARQVISVLNAYPSYRSAASDHALAKITAALAAAGGT